MTGNASSKTGDCLSSGFANHDFGTNGWLPSRSGRRFVGTLPITRWRVTIIGRWGPNVIGKEVADRWQPTSGSRAVVTSYLLTRPVRGRSGLLPLEAKKNSPVAEARGDGQKISRVGGIPRGPPRRSKRRGKRRIFRLPQCVEPDGRHRRCPTDRRPRRPLRGDNDIFQSCTFVDWDARFFEILREA